MIEREREDLRLVRNATYSLMSSMIEQKEHDQMTKRKKLEANRAKARERAKEKKRKISAPNVEALLQQFSQENGL